MCNCQSFSQLSIVGVCGDHVDGGVGFNGWGVIGRVGGLDCGDGVSGLGGGGDV